MYINFKAMCGSINGIRGGGGVPTPDFGICKDKKLKSNDL